MNGKFMKLKVNGKLLIAHINTAENFFCKFKINTDILTLIWNSVKNGSE